MSISSRWTNFFWIAFTGPMLELLILPAFIFRQYLKKWFFFPICIYCISSVANLNILERAYSFITNNNTINLTLICVRGGNFIPLCCFSLNNSEMVKKKLPCHFAAFSNISVLTFVPSLVSLTCPSLEIFGEIQTVVFPTFGFLLNPS